MSKARRWEKPAPAGAPVQSQSALNTITSFVDSLNADERASHRAAYLHLMQALTGANVNVDHADGVKLSGVLHTITPFDGNHAVVIKGCRVQRDASAAPGANDGKTAILDFGKVVTLQNSGKLELVSRNYSTEFATDSSIKKHGDMSHLDGRSLKSVDNSWLQPGNDLSLEGKSSSGKSWDQFETNRRLFNVKDTYDENLYTKKLDLKSMTSEQIAMADRLAREIEGTVSTNIHLQEERGQAPEGDWDEEDRFSGVLKEAPAVKKAPEATNPWKRGAKLTGAAVVAGTASAGASGAASPATPATASNNSSAKAPLTPPPGVTMPAKKPTASNTAAATTGTEAASKTKAEETTSDKSDKAEKAEKTSEMPAEKPEKVEKKTESVGAATTTAPAAATAASADKPVDAAAPEAKPAPVKKLNAAAAEFKPSWMTPSTPAVSAAPVAAVAVAVAPATPVAPSTPQQAAFVPHHQQQFTPSHNNNYGSPDMYNKQQPQGVHSPGFVHQVPVDGAYGAFDPNGLPMGMLPPQFMPGSPPMNMNMNMYDQNGNPFFMPPPQMMQQMPMPSSMDYMPAMGNMNNVMPMQMMPVGMQGMYPPMAQNMPMHDASGMYQMPPNMAFQPMGGVNMNMNMNMMPQQQQPGHQIGMYPNQQGYNNNNNNMGSGQKPKFNNSNNDMRNNTNKGGRGMGGGRGYNGNNGNSMNGGGRGGYGNSPQHGGMPAPSGPNGSDGAPDSA